MDRHARESYGSARDVERDDDWDDRYDDRPVRRRRGVFGRAFALLKFALLIAPLAIFLYGSFVADCRSNPLSGGWAGFLGAGACARNEIVGSAFSMQDNFALLKRLVE